MAAMTSGENQQYMKKKNQNLQRAGELQKLFKG